MLLNWSRSSYTPTKKVKEKSSVVIKNISDERIDTLSSSKKKEDITFSKHFNSLPVKADIQKLKDSEVHLTPEIIKEAGARIGSVHAQAQTDPAKRADAMKFFKSCAEDSEVISPIRAVCLSKIYKLIPIWKIPMPITQEKIPDSVTQLALKLP